MSDSDPRPLRLAVRRAHQGNPELGADGYFIEPIDPHEFISLIETVVASVAESGTVPPGEHAEFESAT